MSNIGIIGYGIVGQAVEHGFKDTNNILYYDKYKPSNPLEDVVKSSEFIFICLPTPYKEDRIDLSIMNESIEKIAELSKNTNKIIIIKSTIIPGTTKGYSEQYPKCNFCFNPEFLTEANYLDDFVNPDRIVIGANNKETGSRVTGLYRNRFPRVPIFNTDLTTAETVKYAANCLLATKLMFANEIFDLCRALGVEYNDVKKMVIADRRIGESHLDVSEDRGFGGKCFPKDIVALLGVFEDMGVDASLLRTVWDKNLKIRKTKDWEEIPFVKTG